MDFDSNETDQAIFSRILIKFSGESLLGEQTFGIDSEVAFMIADEIISLRKIKPDLEIAAVIGGGNIIRGLSAEAAGYDRVTGDQMGMLATVINALSLQNALEKKGLDTRVQTAIAMHEFAEPYIMRRAVRHLAKKRVVIFAAGTGNPYFSTDTAAALRALEIGAEVVLKATKVDGIFSANPDEDPSAFKYDELTYLEVLQKNLKVMDQTAVSLCRENQLPIIVFNIQKKGNLAKVLIGEKVGTIVRGE